MATTRTQVAIIGAGPAGLLLGQMLQRSGIDATVIESRSRAHVEERIRAGVLEQGTADTLREWGVGERMDRQGLVHHGIELRFEGVGHRIDLSGLTGGKHVTVYGQHEVVRDLIAARVAPLVFEVADTAVHDIATEHPYVTYTQDGVAHRLDAEIIAGCDGFHGICRAAVPDARFFDRSYPFAWLGILAEAPPPTEELIYARHERGFALSSMRSPTLSRLYLQCRPDEDLGAWSDARIWEELHLRLGTDLTPGPVLQKGVTAMRSFVTEPMRHGRLFLAGDAAHIVPPTGAKGMNLAVADIRVLFRALEAFFRNGDQRLMEGYSATCLKRIWKAQRFSWWMTSMLHRFDDDDAFEHRVQVAELDYVCSSRAAMTTLAENYVGLPLDV
ncbi:4-hydroxybenzoate 3-monooxygenase [Humitalea sp. 24SJ18S-53]|uniref:4-hydroxybenzoate 3-monooxygenase n=1 Tax=Humitalea sp. 24SJ18S-53 TaxID=3422307 RepID=UPI003D676983